MVEKVPSFYGVSGLCDGSCGQGLETLLLVLRLGRFHFLLGGFLVYSIGYLFAGGGGPLDMFRFSLGYSILFTAQLSVSYSNDYFDRDVDVFAERTPVSGGSGVLVEYPHLMPLSRGIAVFLILSSLFLAFVYWFLFSGGLFVFVFVVVGNAMGWFYSAPPLRLAYRGWGEVANVAAMGLFIPGWGYYCSLGGFGWDFVFLALPMTLYGIFFVLSVQLPDMEADARGKKWTFVARMGRRRGAQTIALASILAVASLFLILLYIPRDMLNPSAADYLSAIAIFSTLPLAASIRGILHPPLDHHGASRYATFNIAALMLFGAAVNLFILYQIYG